MFQIWAKNKKNSNLKAWFVVVQRVVKVLIKLKLVFGC
jgi:hypothetical protein